MKQGAQYKGNSGLSQNQVEVEARDWIVHLASDSVTEKDQQAFQDWLETAPEHRQTYDQINAIWAYLGEDAELKQSAVLNDPLPEERLYRVLQVLFGVVEKFWQPVPLAVAGAAALAFLAYISVFGWQAPISHKQYQTDIAEVQTVQLPDGSRLTLGGKTDLDVRFDLSARTVVLNSGEAFFEVEKDSFRPFTVIGGEASLTVLGTSFNMHRVGQTVKIAVADGLVQVSASDGGKVDHVRQLEAGQQISVYGGESLGQVGRVGAVQPGAWRDGRLVYVDASLADVVADANRYFTDQITFTDDALGNLRLTTVFRTNQMQDLLASLEQTLPIVVERNKNGEVLLVMKKE